MQKSRNATIAIIVGIFFYVLLANLKLVKEFNIIYLYIINPLFWIGLSILLYSILGKNIENKKMREPIIKYTIIAILTLIIVYMLSGLIVTFGRNPNSTTLKGLAYNLWIFGSVMVAKEYIRYKLINNVYDKDKTKIAIILVIVYIVAELDFNRILGNNITIFSSVKYFVQTVIPLISKNIVFSYTAIYSGYFAAVLYQLLTNLYFWISPILPNAPWIMSTIIQTTIPIVLFLYIRFVKNKLDIFRSRTNIINTDPRNIVPLIIGIIMVIWFTIGIFPIKPIAIASGSMEKELFVGDVAIKKKCNANDVNVGDIIEYQMEGYTVIHRIIEKKQKNGDYYFVTKGDNNRKPDKDEVREEQLIGKLIFKIRYIGYPAVWLQNLRVNEQMIEVET